MTQPAFSICVYCGSRPGTDPGYQQAAVEVGQWIAHHGGQLVYGGGTGGLMGVVANAALQAGARVIGVIPKSLVEREWAHHGCTELHIVDTMHDRKRMMAERADAFLALPGGIGTLEELFEVWTWRQLGYHDKPIGILNTAGYYQGLLDFMRHAVRQEFLNDAQWNLVQAADTAAELLPGLVRAAGSTTAAPLTLI
jgi:uncharacterized protein (TIGR00730 family)